TLLTDALRNTSYDWALWGNPRVLVFRNADLQESGTNQSRRATATIPAGALAVKTAQAFKLRIVPDSGEPPIELSHAGPLASRQWFVRDFIFTNAERVEIDWEPREAIAASDVRVGAYLPCLKLAHFSAARAVINTTDSVPLHVEVKNEGRGTLPA